MGINGLIQEKLAYLWGDSPEQIIAWIETFISIVDKQSRLVKFKLTPEQRYFVEHMGKNSIVAKGRQQGLSSVIIALTIREAIINPYSTSLLASYSQRSTESLWNKLNQQFNSLPDFIRPKLETCNRQEMKMSNGSSIVCQNVGNKEISRGSTISGVAHLSEFSLWKNQRKQLTALSQAVSSTGRICIESTANGVGDEFYSLYFASKDNETSYHPFFFGWIEGKTLFEEEYKYAVKQYKAQKGKLLTEDELTDDEKILIGMGANLSQCMWRSA